MMDTNTIWEEAARAARAEIVATQVVVPLRSAISDPPLSDAHRRAIAEQSLERAAMQLEILGDDIADEALLSFLDAFDARLTRRRFALRMRMGLVHLMGVMGRAP